MALYPSIEDMKVDQMAQSPMASAPPVPPSTIEYMGLNISSEQVAQMSVQPCNQQGLFVALVQDHSAAALAGLRFGDQILQINGQTVAGWDNDTAHKFFKQCSEQNISIAVRDRPFERTITMQKDSNGFIGFVFKDGKINSLMKDSSAARNGLLTEHQLIEVHGQNVVGLKDDGIGNIIEAAGQTVAITIMPTFIYEHIFQCMGDSLVKDPVNISIPDW